MLNHWLFGLFLYISEPVQDEACVAEVLIATYCSFGGWMGGWDIDGDVHFSMANRAFEAFHAIK
jgi:hypothetical protein